MTKTIFVTRKIPEKAIELLKSKGYSVDVNPSDAIPSQKQIIKALKKKSYDAVITLLTDHIDAKVFDEVPSVRMYANYASGYDNIDIAEAKKRGITITNAPSDVASRAVAEHAIALMLALSMRIVEADTFVRQGKYEGWSPMNFIGTDISGKTIGLIGAGRIGEWVVHYAKGLGLNSIYFDVVRNEKIESEYGATYYASVEDVLKQADFVSLHVPLLDSTRHLINRERLGMMKPSSFLVNTSRGPIIDEEALVDALKTGIIRGAALDVFENEPRLARGLVKLNNVILTPHIGSASEEARDQMAEIAANNIIDFFEGRIPRNIVNK